MAGRRRLPHVSWRTGSRFLAESPHYMVMASSQSSASIPSMVSSPASSLSWWPRTMSLSLSTMSSFEARSRILTIRAFSAGVHAVMLFILPQAGSFDSHFSDFRPGNVDSLVPDGHAVGRVSVRNFADVERCEAPVRFHLGRQLSVERSSLDGGCYSGVRRQSALFDPA